MMKERGTYERATRRGDNIFTCHAPMENGMGANRYIVLLLKNEMLRGQQGGRTAVFTFLATATLHNTHVFGICSFITCLSKTYFDSRTRYVSVNSHTIFYGSTEICKKGENCHSIPKQCVKFA